MVSRKQRLQSKSRSSTPPNVPTFGASYTAPPASKLETTRLRMKQGLPAAWRSLRIIVLPMCHGKSTLIRELGGYDFDEVVGNRNMHDLDKQGQHMLYLREKGLLNHDHQAAVEHNQLMLDRACRFFMTCAPDDNMPVLFVHTAEIADAIGGNVIMIGSITEQALLSCSRMLRAPLEEQGYTLTIARDQIAANSAYSNRHPGVDAFDCESHADMRACVIMTLTKFGLYEPLSPHNVTLHNLSRANSEKAMLEYAYEVVRDPSAGHARAVAARHIHAIMGDAQPQESQAANNYAAWARLIHTIYGYGDVRIWDKPKNMDDTYWREHFPYGPGHSTYALARIQDWLDRTPDSAYHSGYSWFKQMRAQPAGAVSYERALGALLYSMLCKVALPDNLYNLCEILPMGALPLDDYVAVGKEVHALVRSSGSFFGNRVTTREMAVLMYWDTLAGRVNRPLDMEPELADRLRPVRAKKFYRDGSWSTSLFDEILGQQIASLYNEMAVGKLAKLRKLADEIGDMDDFLTYRRKWMKPGSVTGSPKTDLYLKVPRERMDELDEVMLDTGEMVVGVLQQVRLNKSALAEFADFPALVKRVLATTVPNSYTRVFGKMEAGRTAARALYPAHLLHYIVTCHVLYLAEKGGTIKQTRLQSENDAQLKDHWLWRDLQPFTMGVMLDYANFNEQHDLDHMRLTITELRSSLQAAHIVQPQLQASIDWISDSYDLICYSHNNHLVRFTHGLLSGWRNTTWTNSLLNVAYLRTIAQQIQERYGAVVLTGFQSGGDDVASPEKTVWHAHLILKTGAAMNFEFKAIKQLISHKYYEFFRLLISEEGVYGSACRMIGSTASGQWSNSVLAKFVEPAAKLRSIFDIVAKAGRRSRLDATFMEKLCLVAFDKWATIGEQRLVAEQIHGTVETGGLGVPMVDGSVYELSGERDISAAAGIQFVNVPDDASRAEANRMQVEVHKLLGVDATLPVEATAQAMAAGVFNGLITQMRGVGLAQRVAGMRVRSFKVVRKKSISMEECAAKRVSFHKLYNRHTDEIAAWDRLAGRYNALAPICKPKLRPKLMQALAPPGVDYERVYAWLEEVHPYGPGVVWLTEDYYKHALILAVMMAPEPTSDDVSLTLAGIAYDLLDDGFMYY